MGRVKSTFVKRSAQEIYEKGQEEFTADFDANKKVIDRYAKIPSKKLKNTMTGYITRLSRQSQTE